MLGGSAFCFLVGQYHAVPERSHCRGPKMYPNTFPRYFLGLKPVFNKVWPGRIVASLVFFVASIGILGIYTLQTSPTLVLDSKYLSSGAESKIQRIEELTLDALFFRDLPEFFSPTGEAGWIASGWIERNVPDGGSNVGDHNSTDESFRSIGIGLKQ